MKSTIAFILTALLLPALLIAAPQPLKLGSPAPDFELPGIEGGAPYGVKTYRLSDFSDARLLAVIFTCNHCPTAQYYEGRIKQLAEDYADRGVAVVAISPNDPEAVRLDELGWADMGDSFEEMIIRARDHAFNFPYLYAGGHEETAKAYGPLVTPHAFVFNDSFRDPLINAFNPEWQGVAPYTVLINPEGEVVYEVTGGVDPLELRRTILRELNARKPW